MAPAATTRSELGRLCEPIKQFWPEPHELAGNKRLTLAQFRRLARRLNGKDD